MQSKNEVLRQKRENTDKIGKNCASQARQHAKNRDFIGDEVKLSSRHLLMAELRRRKSCLCLEHT